MFLYTLTKNPIIQHQYRNNSQNQPQKELQKFHQMNSFLTNQFLITKMPLKKRI